MDHKHVIPVDNLTLVLRGAHQLTIQFLNLFELKTTADFKCVR